MNKQNEFKSGDLVYCPHMSSKIFELKEYVYASYAVKIDTVSFYESFTRCGRAFPNSLLPAIFHATEENKAALERLHGVEFEKPKQKPTPRQVIENKLQTAKFATCLVGDRYDWDGMALIVSVKDGNDGAIEYIDGMGNAWYDAQLIDDSGCEIWEIEE